ncbi:CBS domain-containing protein [Aliishimia ponticola]|uniref:CBS domain-containing protein n=1 Tax=Aliishimia ponticola TaxID=2499833 RepID=A0A4S4NJD5_9RHOB|nr:CBS domain-containing protein [Aliishimia ponticola]THH38351.1 CBS domain-containing protein [Aliishimia ponticola]
MLVRQILKSKADDAVVTVPPGTSVREAADVLAKRKIGTVVISEDGQKALGILSERDIVRELAAHGAAVLTEPVDTYMTTKLVTCKLDASAEAVLATMTEKRFRHMPVVEEGQMVGIITLGDAVKAQMAELKMEKDALEGMIMGY